MKTALFQKLQQMKVLLNKPSHTEAEMEENIDKNRDVSVLPGTLHIDARRTCKTDTRCTCKTDT